jgi:chromosome segregation ATPase
MEDARLATDEMERDLHHARSEATRNKEESECIRKRLADRQAQYRELQQRYDACLMEKNKLEREQAKAQQTEALRKAQEEGSWERKVTDLREKRRMAEEDVHRLIQENLELHAFCDGLLSLASQSVEAMVSGGEE